MQSNENNHDKNNGLNGPHRHKLLSAWEEEQMRNGAPYAKHLRKIERLHPELTSTAHRVCAGIMLRKRSWEIGQLFGTAEGTVNNHRSNIRKKLGFVSSKVLSSYLMTIVDGGANDGQ